MHVQYEWLLIGDRGKVAHFTYRTPRGWVTLCSRETIVADKAGATHAKRCEVCLRRERESEAKLCSP